MAACLVYYARRHLEAERGRVLAPGAEVGGEEGAEGRGLHGLGALVGPHQVGHLGQPRLVGGLECLEDRGGEAVVGAEDLRPGLGPGGQVQGQALHQNRGELHIDSLVQCRVVWGRRGLQ